MSGYSLRNMWESLASRPDRLRVDWENQSVLVHAGLWLRAIVVDGRIVLTREGRVWERADGTRAQASDFSALSRHKGVISFRPTMRGDFGWCARLSQTVNWTRDGGWRTRVSPLPLPPLHDVNIGEDDGGGHGRKGRGK